MRELPRGLTEKKGFIAALKRYPTKNQNFWQDRKSTRLNSSHQIISYAVFCLKKKKTSHLSPFLRPFLLLTSHSIVARGRSLPRLTSRSLRNHQSYIALQGLNTNPLI